MHTPIKCFTAQLLKLIFPFKINECRHLNYSLAEQMLALLGMTEYIDPSLVCVLLLRSPLSSVYLTDRCVNVNGQGLSGKDTNTSHS